MRRTIRRTTKKADAILFADAHLRLSQPINRKDDFVDSMWRKIDFISALQEKHECPVLHSGDLFDHWKPSPYLMTLAIRNLPKNFYTVVGNHDLPQNNMQFIDKAGVQTLAEAGAVKLLENGHWNDLPDKPSIIIKGRKILVWHKFIYKSKEFWKSELGGFAPGILRKNKEFDLILTGDNHEAFVETYKGRLLVNPGSMCRTTTKQIDFQPRVYLWYADTNTVEPVYLPIEEDVFDLEKAARMEERETRMSAFVKSLDTDWEGGSTIEENFDIFFRTNATKQDVQELVLKAIDHER